VLHLSDVLIDSGLSGDIGAAISGGYLTATPNGGGTDINLVLNGASTTIVTLQLVGHTAGILTTLLGGGDSIVGTADDQIK
jgi:hypothetical protein